MKTVQLRSLKDISRCLRGRAAWFKRKIGSRDEKDNAEFWRGAYHGASYSLELVDGLIRAGEAGR